MLSEFKGKVAVVTGAASGIGRALCEGFGEEQMRVVCADIDVAGAEATAAALDEAIAVGVDVADQAGVDDLADRAFGQWGQVDLLCNNAGVFQAGLTWQRSIADWEWTLGVNLYGIIHGINAFVPRMIAQGTDGHIVNTASVAAFISAPAVSPYTVSKSAAFTITECLAHDLRSVNARIGASVLTPSSFDTGIAHTGKVRPQQYGTDETEDGRAMVETLAAITSTGLQPEAVVEPVLEGIRTGAFLIPTKPSFEQQLQDRWEALRRRELPSVTIVD